MAFFGKQTFIIEGNKESVKTVTGIFGISDGVVDANSAEKTRENFYGRLIVKLCRFCRELGVKIPDKRPGKRAAVTEPNKDLLCGAEKWMNYAQSEYNKLVEAENNVKSKVNAESFFAYLKKSKTDFGFFASSNFAVFAGTLTLRNYRRFCKKILDISEITVIKLNRKKNSVYFVCLSTWAQKVVVADMLDDFGFRKIDEKMLFLADRTKRELIQSIKENKRALALLEKRKKQTAKEYSRKLNELFSELVTYNGLCYDLPVFYSDGERFVLAVKVRKSDAKKLCRMAEAVKNIEFEMI